MPMYSVIACFNGPTQWELLELATTTTQHVLELATNSYSGVAVSATLESEGHQLKNNEGANATDLQFVCNKQEQCWYAKHILPFLPLSSPLVVPHRRLFHPHCCHGQPHTNGFAFGTDCTDSSDSPSAASLAAGGSAAVPHLLGIALVANKPHGRPLSQCIAASPAAAQPTTAVKEWGPLHRRLPFLQAKSNAAKFSSLSRCPIMTRLTAVTANIPSRSQSLLMLNSRILPASFASSHPKLKTQVRPPQKAFKPLASSPLRSKLS
ncbi:hypothetical protein B0H13DRAFT_2263867 [Mycena leptocephala]|nr:hypothetical protein B0H13DRAFT_2263867 [Mycena leptocephala]